MTSILQADGKPGFVLKRPRNGCAATNTTRQFFGGATIGGDPMKPGKLYRQMRAAIDSLITGMDYDIQIAKVRKLKEALSNITKAEIGG